MKEGAQVKDYTSPERIAIGEKFTANGKSHEIKIIVASQAENDMSGYGLDIKKGESTCAAAETTDDLDFSDESGSKLWLYIRHCRPTR